MATRTAKPRPSRPAPVQHPKRRGSAPPSKRWWLLGGIGVAAAGAAIALGLALSGGSDKAGAAGLPAASDYHSLLVAPGDPQTLLLGTHQGLYRSSDGGRSWGYEGLSGQDAMNLSRAAGKTLWVAGHNVLAKSTDGGASWSDVRPAGLPHLDVHGFAVHPQESQTMYAAVANAGLYRSRDGGGSFSLVTSEVGAGVMALAIAPDGRILAGDMQTGLMVSSDSGRSWQQTLQAGLMGLAINPSNPEEVLASGPGVFLSADGGRTWQQVLELPEGAGPIAWSASAPQTAYAVGFDRSLHRSDDGGRSWQQVV